MGFKRGTKNNVALSSTFMLLLIGLANSDINQDKAECSDQLIGLANCLPYVEGQAKVPTIDCCSGLKMVIDKSKRCLCVLIKDRDDPSLGLNINVSLALNLPTACHTTTNLTQCVDLLHLAPKSPDAKVFEGFDKAIGKNSSSSIPTANSDASRKGTSTSAQDKSGGGWGKRLQVAEVICGILPLLFISQFFFLV
ncbi:hypothetical protein Lal_00006524 [Lupinus albus]|uniref:Putative bifunctional inhibitor/plant lipid transfer protein/seed storage helical n=1 Tax=Lupinus albus TaxID=3870 RepID=A0A6A4Q949_LUPAL|nr:putative bifunctional inhibitor/plant lipid transfer protein/seed storage helical [Lupinus albus]KAF1875893.1 hypothetical protein Lal_00006524 [Lupinus albus]